MLHVKAFLSFPCNILCMYENRNASLKGFRFLSWFVTLGKWTYKHFPTFLWSFITCKQRCPIHGTSVLIHWAFLQTERLPADHNFSFPPPRPIVAQSASWRDVSRRSISGRQAFWVTVGGGRREILLSMEMLCWIQAIFKFSIFVTELYIWEHCFLFTL